MDFASKLKGMKIQSATNITLESLKHMLRFSINKGFGKEFDKEIRNILAARPTAVVLHNAINIVRKKRNERSLLDVIDRIKNAKITAAKNSSHIIRGKKTILTHCHSSFVVSALVKNKKNIKEVIVTETRPRDQGVITAKELLENKIKTSFIIDSAIGDFIKKADMVLVGADALRKEGLVNKVGTYPIALAAKENRTPFYVVTSTFAVDKRKAIKIEQRPASELGHRSLKGANIFNPAFDITPWEYITGIVTEKGIMRPKTLIRLYGR